MLAYYCIKYGKGNKAAKKALKRIEKSRDENNKDTRDYSVNEKNNSSTTSQVAAQGSGCLLPILVTFLVIGIIVSL